MDLYTFSDFELRSQPISKLYKSQNKIIIIKENLVEYLSPELKSIYKIYIKDKILSSFLNDSDLYLGSENKIIKISDGVIEEEDIDGSVVSLGYQNELIYVCKRNGKYYFKDIIKNDNLEIYCKESVVILAYGEFIEFNGTPLKVGNVRDMYIYDNILYICNNEGYVVIVELLNFVVKQMIKIRKSALNSIIFYNDSIFTAGEDSRLVCLKKLRNEFQISFQVDTHYSPAISIIELNNVIYTAGLDGYINQHFLKDTHFIFQKTYYKPLIKIKNNYFAILLDFGIKILNFSKSIKSGENLKFAENFIKVDKKNNRF